MSNFKLVGVRHMIKCRCILKQFEKIDPPLFHQFLVFSVLENDIIRPKIVQCQNCGIIHRIVDIGKSDIIEGREHMSSILTMDDVKASLSPRIVSILETHNADLAIYEHVAFIIENERWGDFVVLATDYDGADRHIKYVKIYGTNLAKIETFSRKEDV